VSFPDYWSNDFYRKGTGAMPNFSRYNQYALAAITAAEDRVNSDARATEQLAVAQKTEEYTNNLRVSVSKEGVYTFRTYS